MAPMGKKLTEAQIERYHRDGFVYPIDAFAAEEAWRYRRAMEEFEAAQGRELTKGQNFKPHLLFTWVDEIVHHPAILDAVEDVIGPDIRLFHLSVWPKNAGDAAYVSWHQDATYFGLEPPLQVTAWVALTDASIEAGCMEVIPGSHKLGQLHHAEHSRSEEHTSELQSLAYLVCRLLLEKKKKNRLQGQVPDQINYVLPTRPF